MLRFTSSSVKHLRSAVKPNIFGVRAYSLQMFGEKSEVYNKRSLLTYSAIGD